MPLDLIQWKSCIFALYITFHSIVCISVLITTGMAWVTPSPLSITIPVSVRFPTCFEVHDAANAKTAWKMSTQINKLLFPKYSMQNTRLCPGWMVLKFTLDRFLQTVDQWHVTKQNMELYGTKTNNILTFWTSLKNTLHQCKPPFWR